MPETLLNMYIMLLSILPSGGNIWIAIPSQVSVKFTHTVPYNYSYTIGLTVIFYLKEEGFRILHNPIQRSRSLKFLCSCLAFISCMECHLSTTLALCAVAPPRCGVADVKVLGTVQQNTSTTSVYSAVNHDELMITMVFYISGLASSPLGMHSCHEPD